MTQQDLSALVAPPVPSGLTAGIHWLAFTTRMELYDVLEALVDHVCLLPDADVRGVFLEVGHGGKGYKRMLTGPHGMLVFCSDDRDDLHVVVPGRACENAGTDNLLKLFALPIKPTRIDVALDGLKKPDGSDVKPADLYALCRFCPEQVRTKCNIRVDESLPPEERSKSLSFHQNGQGDTCEIGSRTSERFARVYDRRGYCRFELEIKGDKAEQLGEILDGKKASKIPALVVGLIARFVSFVEQDNDSNKTRAELQDWWAAIVNGADDVKLAGRKRDLLLDRTWQWLLRIAPSVTACVKAAIENASGDLYTVAEILMDRGERNFTGRHQLLVAGAKGWTPG
jgi:hypothetical protein